MSTAHAEAQRREAAARVRTEALIPLHVAAEKFPARNSKGHVSAGSLLRWIVGGKRGVRLDAVRLSGVWYTSMEAIERFRDALGL